LVFGIRTPRTLLPLDRAAVTATPLAAPTNAAPPAINGIFALLAALAVAWPAFCPASPIVSRTALTPLATLPRERLPEFAWLGDFLAAPFRLFAEDRLAAVDRRLAAPLFAASDREVFVVAIRHLAHSSLKNPEKVPEPSWFPLFRALNNPRRAAMAGGLRSSL
jgi:hypothetical protein